MTKKKITTEDFLRMFNCRQDELPEQFVTKFRNVDTTYSEANLDEYKEFFLNTLKYIDSVNARNETETYRAFEKGWNENLKLFSDTGSLEDLIPKYVKPSKFLRFNQELIVTENPRLEYELFTLARYIIFSKYLKSFDNIYEFGCGSCQNLYLLSQMYHSKQIYGMDWSESSVKIANKLGQQLNMKGYLFDMKGYLFDMMRPQKSFKLQQDSAVFTVGALELLGTDFDKFLSFLVRSKPGVVLHYEPIREFYDPECLLDYLAIMHDSKRNYLSGYLTRLKELQDQNKIEIIESRRTYLGGPHHEATSIIAWKPL